MALSGHWLVHCKCPLLRVKQTWRVRCDMSANAPKRTCLSKPYGLTGYVRSRTFAQFAMVVSSKGAALKNYRDPDSAHLLCGSNYLLPVSCWPGRLGG